jgi:ABC-type Fe3+/spermidine/putrescine transport system ATPase subunit
VTLLSLADVTVETPDSTILAVDRLEVARGEVLAVLGPTGAGKSTLLRLAALIQRPSSGVIAWSGKPVDWPPPLALRRRVAMAFQDPLPFAGSVAENVAWGLAVRGVGRQEATARVGEALEMFGIGDLAGRPATTVSGGEAQRMALARAIVVRPDLLLLDEPLASLDPPIKERLIADLGRTTREWDLTVVHVTHDRDEAIALANRIAILDRGLLLQVGTPEEVFYRPSCRRVAEFLGMTNLLAGTVAAKAGVGREVVVGPLRLRTAARLDVGSPVLVCIRPEDVSLGNASAPAATGGTNRIGGVVRETATRGTAMEVEIDCGVLVRSLAPRRVVNSLGLVAGSQVTLQIDPEAIHVLPEATHDQS